VIYLFLLHYKVELLDRMILIIIVVLRYMYMITCSFYLLLKISISAWQLV